MWFSHYSQASWAGHKDFPDEYVFKASREPVMKQVDNPSAPNAAKELISEVLRERLRDLTLTLCAKIKKLLFGQSAPVLRGSYFFAVLVVLTGDFYHLLQCALDLRL